MADLKLVQKALANSFGEKFSSKEPRFGGRNGIYDPGQKANYGRITCSNATLQKALDEIAEQDARLAEKYKKKMDAVLPVMNIFQSIH